MSVPLPQVPEPAVPPYDCTACGVCCALGWDVYLTEDDAARFERSPQLRRLMHQPAQGALRRVWFLRRDPDTDHCMAFAAGEGGCGCTIYEDRPFLCRDFAVGSEHCQEARRATIIRDSHLLLCLMQPRPRV